MRSQTYEPFFVHSARSGGEKSVGYGLDHGFMQYEPLPDGALGAIFQGATCIVGLRGHRNAILKGTEVCHWTATDLHESAFDLNGILGDYVPRGIDNLSWLDEVTFGINADTLNRDSSSQSTFFAGVSTLFLCILCYAFGRTCPLMHFLLQGRPLRGSDQRSKLVQWILIGYFLLVAIQVVSCQIFVSGGVHIRPDYLSIAIQVQATLAFSLLFVRLGLRWRCDRIGACRLIGNSRKSVIRPRLQGIKLKAVFMCLNIASSHATQVFHSCEQGAMFVGNLSSASGLNENDRLHNHSSPALRDPVQSIMHCPDSPRAPDRGPIEQRTETGDQSGDALLGPAAGGSALPEATFCESETSPSSWPCEGDSRAMIPNGTEEGHCHSSTNCQVHDSDIGSVYQAIHADDRPTFLGNFVIDPRTQEPLGVDVGHVWGTALMQWLKQAELFHHLRVMQGHFGAKSAKPTNLLIAGLSAETTSALESESRTSSCPKAASIRLEGRSWATSSLTEYPRDFCRFLAQMFDRWMLGATRVSGPPPSDVTWLKAMYVSEVETHCQEGPDFNPRLIKNSRQQGAES